MKNIIKDTNKDFNIHINYAGGFYDKDTKFIRFSKRDYSPEQRRWTAIDPIGFDGGDLNLYGYVLIYPFCGNNQSCKRDVEKLLYDCMKDKLKCD